MQDRCGVVNRLNIGRMPYANVFPIFYAIKQNSPCDYFDFIDGVPSKLNLLLREGKIHISPSSSIEYLKYPELYTYVANHSISARGRVGSIYLFTKVPINELNNHTIYVTAQSDTSSMLLRIILEKFYSFRCNYIISHTPSMHNGAFLLIGDDAIKQQKLSSGLIAYDLSELWFAQTGLPFVFALWIVRKDVLQTKQTQDFIALLSAAKEYAFNHLQDIAIHCPLSKELTSEDVLQYWQLLDYDLSDEHLRGLELFNRLLRSL